MNIEKIATRVFEMYMDNSEQIFTDSEYSENLSAEYPELSPEEIITGIEIGKVRIQDHIENLKNRQTN